MQKHTHLFLSALALLLPAHASAATIDVLDTVAGLATEIVVTDLTPRSQVTLSVESPIAEVSQYTLNASEDGLAHTWITGSNLKVAGQYSIDVVSNGKTSIGTLTVHPDSIDTLASVIDVPSTEIDVGEEMTVTVVLTDRFGNALAGRSVELISSRPSDLVQPLSRETDLYGEQQFLLRASEPGVSVLRAIDLISGQTLQDSVSVSTGDLMGALGGPVTYTTKTDTTPSQTQFYRGNPYAASVLSAPSPYRAQVAGEAPRFDHFEIDIIGQEERDIPELEQFKSESVLLTAVDQYGNQFKEFTGRIYMASTDPDAVLPAFGIYDFSFQEEGQLMLSLGLKFSTVHGNQPTEHTIILTENPDEIPANLDDALGYITVRVTPTKSVQTRGESIFITSPTDGALTNTSDVVVEGTGPAFINITAQGGLEDIESETDREGNFAITVPLDPEQTEHTITVIDSDAPGNFAEVTFSIDVTPPAINSIVFTPENPVEGTDVLAVVNTEPQLADITLTFNEETYSLQSNDPSSGKYQVLLTAPEGGGVFDVVVDASDAQGNTAQSTKSLAVGLLGLPKVQNVVAEAEIDAISLRWDPITQDDIDAYRIYVGTSPDEFSYTLDTDRPTAAATVAGLRPGSTYYFAVTALEGERESEEKSDVMGATVLGVNLDITPNDGALFIEWTSLQQNIPLSSFILEYGTEAGQYTEQRPLNGDLRAYTLRDLINSVTYYIKLTPIATTGERLEDLSTEGQGTPIGAGFTQGTSDPVPSNLRASAPPTPRPVTEIPLSEQGVPMWMFWTILAVSALVFRMYLAHRKKQLMTTAFLQAMESRYHQ